MRKLFLILVLINLAFFYWQYEKQERPAANTDNAPVMDSTVHRLVLRSELPDNPATEDQPQPETQIPPQEPQLDVDQLQEQQQPGEIVEKPVLTCYRLGPVTTIHTAATVSTLLENAGVTSVTRETEDRIPNGFWVHLPLEKDAATAQRILEEIQNRNISDVSTVPQSEGGYVISVGVFSEEIRAKRRQSQFIKLGYKPVIDERYKVKILTWFDVMDSESTLLVPEVFTGLVAKFPDIKMQEIDC